MMGGNGMTEPAAVHKSFLNRIFSTLESRLWPFRVNWLKTVYFNLRSMPLPVAIKLPVYIYAHTQFSSLSGRVEIRGEVRRGMVRIGKREDRGQGITNIRNLGQIVFHDGVTIMQGCDIYVGPKGRLEIGSRARIRENVFIYATALVKIGEMTGIAFQTTISDDDFHYILDTKTGQAADCKAAVVIGARNWIGSRTVIKKGTITPDDIIVASSYSLLSKDYTASVPPFSVLGGVPARLLKDDVRRVFDRYSEAALHRHYATGDKPFALDLEKQDADAFCLGARQGEASCR
jgi:acetyltransferase-like isoleucine patch superfamily enzyme